MSSSPSMASTVNDEDDSGTWGKTGISLSLHDDNDNANSAEYINSLVFIIIPQLSRP